MPKKEKKKTKKSKSKKNDKKECKIKDNNNSTENIENLEKNNSQEDITDGKKIPNFINLSNDNNNSTAPTDDNADKNWLDILNEELENFEFDSDSQLSHCSNDNNVDKDIYNNDYNITPKNLNIENINPFLKDKNMMIKNEGINLTNKGYQEIPNNNYENKSSRNNKHINNLKNIFIQETQDYRNDNNNDDNNLLNLTPDILSKYNILNNQINGLKNKNSLEIENKKSNYFKSPENNNNDDKNKQINEKNIVITNDCIIFGGKEFKDYSRINRYKEERKIKKTIYKCVNIRKDERIRKNTNQPIFCNGTIEYIEPNQNVKSGYFFVTDHSVDCYKLSKNIFEEFENEYQKEKIKKENIIKDKENFIIKCNQIMDTSNIYDRNIFKQEFLKIYNMNKYNFPINNNLLSNIITRWKNSSVRFTKNCIIWNMTDYQNRLILRDYRVMPYEKGDKISTVTLEYAMWANDENIIRIRKSKNYFIDATFHHPPEFKQMLILMYNDYIKNLKIPGIYIIMNSKKEELYDIIFDSIVNILTQNKNIELEVETIVTDQEKALINCVKKYFPTTQRISCLFHYKQDIIRNLRLYGLYKKEFKEESKKITRELGKLPFAYKGNIQYVKTFCDNLSNEKKAYSNYINNYFLPNKLPYFEDNSLNYYNVPKDARTNNFLENYNGYIKNKLGKFRTVNWVNFLNFIKEESDRSIQKLLATNIKTEKYSYKPSKEIKLKKGNIMNQMNNLNKSKTNEYKKDISSDYKKLINDTININTDDNDILKIINKKIGIKNLGNTCYINSFIQILLHNPLFLEQFSHKIKNNAPNENTLSFNLYKICNAYLNQIENKNSILDISDLVKIFKNKHSQFSGLGQKDTTEFFELFLSDISSELNEVKQIPNYYEIKNSDFLSKIEFFNLYYQNFISREKSIITDLFYSQLISIYKCACEKEIYGLQNILDFPILLSNKKSVELKNLLEKYFNSEDIEFFEECTKCKKTNIIHNKTIKIANPPKILILSLQRKNPLNNTKNNCIVYFDEILNLSNYIDEELCKDSEFNYELYGVINHIGSLEFGHYFTFIKMLNNKKWIEYNDSVVKEIDQLDCTNAYCLIYIKS